MLQKLGKVALGVGPNIGAALLQQAGKLRFSGRQAIHSVALCTQVLEQGVQRGHDLQITCRQRTLAGAFVVVNGHFFLGIGHGFEGHAALHQIGKALQSLGQGAENTQTRAVAKLCGNRHGGGGAVQLWQGDGHGQQAAVKAARLIQPCLLFRKDAHGGKQRNIALRQPLAGLIGLAQRQPPMGHVDHGVGLDLL